MKWVYEMTLTDNNAVQLRRKCEADTQDALNLMLAPPARDSLHKILCKLRSATAAMQELERRSVGVTAKIGD